MAKRRSNPNIIFFFADQQRWDTVGCYGQPLEVTPNLDRMAAEGVRFENAFTCQPVCGPARACIQTGKYATEVGVFRNAIALGQDEKTIAHLASEAGYEVGYLGKWHLASTLHVDGEPDAAYEKSPVPPERRGGWKDYWLAADVLEYTSHGYDGHMWDANMNKVEFTGYRVDCLTDFAIEYLRSRAGEKPFFFFISYVEPHHQNDHNRYEGPEGSKERFKDFVVPGDLLGAEGDWRENYPDYLGCCSSLDRNLGRIRKELKTLDIADDTVIFYASDHGSHFCTRNSEYKRSCHEGCIRVPLVACGPGFKGGRVIRELVSLIDLPPTLMQICGADIPAGMRGRPLGDLVDGSAHDWPEEVFLQISESQVGRALRTRSWKYSVVAPDKDGVRDAASDRYVEEFLYNLENDPHEKYNLVRHPFYRGIRAKLAAILKRRMAQAGEKAAVIEPAT